MILARAWGCTPAQLRDVTLGEWHRMVELLTDEHERRQGG